MNGKKTIKKKLRQMLSYSADATTGRNWRPPKENEDAVEGMDKPSVYHATVVIFLEFFAWGLLTSPTITVLGETFPQNTFLMNGLIQGIKGILSFLSAPLIGALSDVWGRKSFLLLTVFFTCAPIPLLRFNPWWFFACLSVSGAFAVTFSIVFAYVADCTEKSERSHAYGLVSATFAASLITSPALGAYLSSVYSDSVVIALATAIALLDILFILVWVPESLPERMRPASWGAPIPWEKADPFNSLRKVGHDPLVLLLCITIFLSYLPEAGQYSCIFLYLQHRINFSREDVAIYIAVVGFLSVVVQTLVLTLLIKSLGLKNCISLALFFQMIQLLWYALGTQVWMMWAAGALAAMSSLTYPAISALISCNADSDQQGVVQGLVTGIRGLCNGLGPALYGVIFYIFHVNLQEELDVSPTPPLLNNITSPSIKRMAVKFYAFIPGPPFLFGACLVFLSLLTALFLPDMKPTTSYRNLKRQSSHSTAGRTLSTSSFDSEYETNEQSILIREDATT
ncbi:hippocampus abundant transcript 1 protein-like isoform X2 [Hydractinia symbiolongicarpus]|nr:hippocampus abundant transcript 1 protein-like isoform X2 [Hydractinia symbiolongicarpus]